MQGSAFALEDAKALLRAGLDAFAHGIRDRDIDDELVALWKDELCALVELRELSRAEVERLLGLALGGPVTGRTASALWQLTLGNALFLREPVALHTVGLLLPSMARTRQ